MFISIRSMICLGPVVYPSLSPAPTVLEKESMRRTRQSTSRERKLWDYDDFKKARKLGGKCVDYCYTCMGESSNRTKK